MWAGNSWGHRSLKQFAGKKGLQPPFGSQSRMSSPSYPAILIPCRLCPHPPTPTAQIILHSLCLLIQDQVWSEVWGEQGMCVFLLPGGEVTLWAYRGLTWSPPLMKPQLCVLECSLCLRWRSKDQNVVAPIRFFVQVKGQCVRVLSSLVHGYSLPCTFQQETESVHEPSQP